VPDFCCYFLLTVPLNLTKKKKIEVEEDLKFSFLTLETLETVWEEIREEVKRKGVEGT